MKSLFARIGIGAVLLWPVAVLAQPWGHDGGSGSLVTLLGAVAFLGLLAFLVGRELLCWYFKINESITLLTEIRDSLKANGSQADGQGGATGNP